MLKINYRGTGELIPYVNNSRTHSDKQVQQVASSIKEFGFTNPILIDEESGIIAGHGRLLAAEKLGLDEVPTITLEGLTETQRKAYVIADNKLALNSGWDDELLKVELENLSSAERGTSDGLGIVASKIRRTSVAGTSVGTSLAGRNHGSVSWWLRGHSRWD